MAMLIAVLLAVATLIIILVLAYLINGWALSYLWKWFIVPFGLPPLSLHWAIGVTIIISLLTNHTGFLTNHTVPQKDDEPDLLKVVLDSFIRPILAVLIGWVVQRYM